MYTAWFRQADSPQTIEAWIHPKYAFFLPVDVLSSVFRAKFVDGLRKAYRQGELVFPGSIAELENPKRFAAFVDSLFQQRVGRIRETRLRRTHPGAPLSGPVYASRRHQQSPLAGLRWTSSVTFRWKDYAHGNKQRKMTLAATEFLRRFHPAHSAARFRPHPAIWIS